MILGDELCSGTESDSALSIFTAGIEQLYDHWSDPMEWNNLVKEKKYEQIKDRLKDLIPKEREATAPRG